MPTMIGTRARRLLNCVGSLAEEGVSAFKNGIPSGCLWRLNHEGVGHVVRPFWSGHGLMGGSGEKSEQG